MLAKRVWAASVVAGVCLGLALSYVQIALAARNSSGTYTLPAGNPVVSGTPISSTVHNNTTSDIATEITDSLNRSGKGAMLAPLELVNGSVATPALSFDSDTDCGLYRIGANNVGIAVNGAKVLDIATTGTTTVGATSQSGNAALTGSDPSSSTGFSDTVTPMNIPKAWGLVHGNGGAAATISAGFNITNIQESGSTLTVDFVNDFGDTNYACVATYDNTPGAYAWVQRTSAGTVTLGATDNANNAQNLATGSVPVHFVCFGAN